MSALDFLSPDRAVAGSGFSPVAKSSMERRQRDAGGLFDERGGWLVPVSFPGEAERLEATGIADLSHLGAIEVRGEGDIQANEAIAVHRVRPGVQLVLCEPRDTFVLRSSLARRFPFVLDQSGAYAVLAVVGPRRDEVMRRLTHLHAFPASGPVAHVAAHVLERDGGFWIVFGQEYGHYLWDVAVQAAERVGGGPVGADAIGRARP